MRKAYKVVDSESFNFYFLGFWAIEVRVLDLVVLRKW